MLFGWEEGKKWVSGAGRTIPPGGLQIGEMDIRMVEMAVVFPFSGDGMGMMLGVQKNINSSVKEREQ